MIGANYLLMMWFNDPNINGVRRRIIYQTGQSGLVWSDNYRDMKQAWASGRYRPLRTQPDAWAHELVLTP